MDRLPAPATATLPRLGPGSPHRLGVHLTEGGADVAVFSDHAARIELCLFDAAGRETARLALPERTGAVWHGHVPGLREGQLYGLRAHGPYDPARGHRFNPHKLLIDPYARRLSGRLIQSDALYGYDRAAPEGHLSFDARDSAPFVPKAVLTAPAPPAPPGPRRDWGGTMIYEAHLRGLTRLMPGLDPAIRGTWDALASDRVIDHLSGLGITAVELLPVQAFADDAFLLERGLVNYWGYNTLAFLAPEPRYLGPGGDEGIRRAVARLHDAGLEVLLDVVYNHTAESDALGPTLSLRGLDNASYYRLDPANRALYVNDTGCGNTLDTSHPFVLRLVLDSLRHWVAAYGIDGFRFDLATALGREGPGFDPGAGFLDALRQDPVLAGVKLVAEPWDIGPAGYRLGGFPPEFGEWNDRFRDDVRRFWRGDPGSAPGLAARLLGSAETFDRAGRRPWGSVNYIASHDGFTLADLTAYAHKHNEANGEGNRDGHSHEISDNLGAEGPTGDPAIRAARSLRRRNLLATLLVSQGTPMLLAGDEIANSQMGNNNAYCQDNHVGWIGWAEADEALHAFLRRLTRLRRAHPVLRQTRFLHGRLRPDGTPDVSWHGLGGGAPDWADPALAGFVLHLRGSAEAPPGQETADEALVAINRGPATPLRLPPPPPGRRWARVLDTAHPDDAPRAEGPHPRLAARSLAVFTPEPLPEPA